VQAECFLGCTGQGRQVVLVVDGAASFDEHDLGCAFDQFFGAADGQCGVVDDRALDAVELLLDGRGSVSVARDRSGRSGPESAGGVTSPVPG
jgi:hypothetical protein